MGGDCCWSEAPEEILTLISERLHTLNDCFNFSCVCKSWKSSVAHFRFPQPPFLMLPDAKTKEEEDQDKSSLPSPALHLRGFLGLIKGGGGGGVFINKVYGLRLPEANQSRCIGSKGNWVVTIDMELNIHILNPFSRLQLDLPSQSTFTSQFPLTTLTNKQLRDLYLYKVVLSSTPNNSNPSRDKCVVVAIHACFHYLSIARPGDVSWTRIQGVDNIDDVIFFKDKLYAITRQDKFFVCELDLYPHRATALLKAEVPHRAHKRYLVEWMGELLLVVRFGSTKVCGVCSYYETLLFMVYKLDFASLKWELLESLGHHSLFLGFNASVSILASDSSTFRGNCIYFTEDHHFKYFGTKLRTERARAMTEGGHDTGVFDLKSRIVQPLHDDIVVTSCFSPPVWVIPNSQF